MANKIDNAMDVIAAQFAELITAKTLRVVERRPVMPYGNASEPILGLVVSRMQRANRIWTAEGLIRVVARKGTYSETDQALTELMAVLDAKLTEAADTEIPATAAGGTPCAVVDSPMWDFWYAAENVGQPLARVGLMGTFKLTTETPLIVS